MFVCLAEQTPVSSQKGPFPFLSQVVGSASRQYAGKTKSASSPSPYSWMKTKHKRSNI